MNDLCEQCCKPIILDDDLEFDTTLVYDPKIHCDCTIGDHNYEDNPFQDD